MMLRRHDLPKFDGEIFHAVIDAKLCDEPLELLLSVRLFGFFAFRLLFP